MTQHYCKYYKQRKYVSYDGITWQPLNEYRKGALYEEDSSDCGYMTEYKWQLVDGYLCSGTTEYQKLQKYESVDGGISWYPSSPEEYIIGEKIKDNSNYCSLEKWVYTIEDGTLPTSYCSTVSNGGAHMPEGIAKSIEFTSGMKYCCGTSFNSGGCVLDKARAYANYGEYYGWASLNIGAYCNNTFCYFSYLIEGKEVKGDCYCQCCCSPRVCACWTVTEFMPWLTNANTIKIIYRQKYTRSSLNDPWVASGLKEYYELGERWVKIESASTVGYDYFQHQLASVDEYGNITWTDEGQLEEYEYETHPNNFEYIDELYNDGDSYLVLQSSEGGNAKFLARYRNGTTPSGKVIQYCRSSYNVDTYSTLECSHTLIESCLNNTFSEYMVSGYMGDGNDKYRLVTLFNGYVVRGVSHVDIDYQGKYHYYTTYYNEFGTSYSKNVSFKYITIADDNGITIWRPAKVVGTSIRGMLSNDYTFVPLSKYEDDYKVLNKKIYATYSNGSGYSVTCDSSSVLTSGETRSLNTISSMTKATVGECVTEIGYSAFSGATSLSSITLHNGITTLGNQAFMMCSGLTSFNFPSGLTRIEGSCFRLANGITSMTVPSGVTYLGSGAFADMSGLTAATIPSSVTEISTNLFLRDSALKEVHFKSTTAPAIGANCMKDCTSLEKIYIPTCESFASYAATEGLSAFTSYFYSEDIGNKCT